MVAFAHPTADYKNQEGPREEKAAVIDIAARAFGSLRSRNGG
jgi:hypothetical protein